MAALPFKVPKAISALGGDVEVRVAELVCAAERHQAAEGMAAVEKSLGLVPRPVRPLVRKVLGV